MSEALYLFVTSERPDQYLNPILHCLQHKNPSKIVFLYVENRGGEDDIGTSARAVRENVEALLSSLAREGKYKYFVGKQKGKEVDLLESYPQDKLAAIKAKYTLLRDRRVPWLDKEIDYFRLRDELARIHREEPESIFDVSAISKSYLGDIFAISVVEGIDAIYTFNLNKSPNFDEPWKMLYHELNFRKSNISGYQYINLTKTYIYEKCSGSILVRRPPLVFSLIAALVLLVILIAISLLFGSTNWFILIVTCLATIASILSLFYIFFPIRR